jgi:hypothetical protein
VSTTLTTRLGLVKPTPGTGENVNLSQMNANLDKIDGSAAGFTVCTSGTKPASPYTGQQIFETDTGNILFWDGSSWVPIQRVSAALHRIAWNNGVSLSGVIDETVVATLTGNLVSGRIYRIWSMTNLNVSNVDTTVWFRVREDNISGSVIRGGLAQHRPESTSIFSFDFQREFDATATGSKTLVVTMQRGVGSGTISCFTSQSRYSIDLVE